MSKAKANDQIALAEPKLIGQNENGKDIYLKNGRFGPYLQYEINQSGRKQLEKKKKKKKKSKMIILKMYPFQKV